LTNQRGTLAMARMDAIDSATRQFFINVADNPHLDHQQASCTRRQEEERVAAAERGLLKPRTCASFGYAVFGRVVAGMEVVDSHSVTISSDGLGSLKFSGEGGSSAVSAIDGTAAGDIWDGFDIASTVHPTGVGGGSNSMFYTLPSMVDGLAITASYTPTGSGTDSATSYAATYTGVEGLSVSYGVGDDTTVGNKGEGTALKASYAIGSFTAAYSDYSFDTTGTSSDDDTTSYKVSYTVSDELSVSYGSETVERGTLKDGEYEKISASYTAGGMTLTASMADAANMDGTTTATQDRELWALGLSFAF
jgi:outer membrane protein OmpU